MFSFRDFQKQDLARLAIPDGCLYGGQPGVGKSLMAIAWAMLKLGFSPRAKGTLLPNGCALIVCGGGLMDQMEREYAGLFGRAFPGVTRIRDQAHFVSLLAAGRGHLPHGWYMSSYERIALNRFQMLPIIPDGALQPNQIRAYEKYYEVPGIEACRRAQQTTAIGLDTERNGVVCLYKPQLAELMRNHFDAVVVDEATHVKESDSIIGLGVRRLNARFRLTLSGTPAKNTLPDIFFLAGWSADALERHNERWPYSPEQFSREFQVRAVNQTAARRRRASPGAPLPRKAAGSEAEGLPIAEVTHIHKLWTVLAPVVLRRRKCDISEQEIVPKHHKLVMVPFGQEQAGVYRHHLAAVHYDRRGQPAIGAAIMALRKICADPSSASLEPCRSRFPFTPKVHAALEIIRGVLERQEQAVLFAPFHDALDLLSGYLSECGIPHDVLDGRLSPGKRAQLAMNFKAGLPDANPVLLAGYKACSEGFSWNLANNVILFSPEQALDLMLQAVDRVHRINSPKPVNVYSLIVQGSIEVRMEAMRAEKAESADIALDGAPGGFGAEEITLKDLLQTAKAEFAGESHLDERLSLEAWPALRDAMKNAWQRQRVQVEKAA